MKRITLFFILAAAILSLAASAQTAPVVSSVYSNWSTLSSATILWTTDIPAHSAVNYGTTINYGQSKIDAAFVTSHSVELTGLSPGTTYHYSVSSCTSLGVCSGNSADQKFNTRPLAPSITATLAANGTDVIITWSAVAGEVDGYIIDRRLAGSGGWSLGSTVGGNVTSFTNTAVPAGSYDYQVRALLSGWSSDPSNIVTVTVGAAGNNVPAAPSNLRLEPLPTTSTIYLKWIDNATNEDKVNVERAPAGSGSWTLLVQLLGSDFTTHSDVVTPGTYYDYRVQACRSGYGCSGYAYLYNVSPAPGGNGGTGTTTTDTIAPAAPTGLTAFASSTSQIFLYWNASTDNVGVTGYKIYRNGTFLISVYGTYYYYLDVGLSAGISYSYTVAAYDAAGNVSSQSSSVSVTIPTTTTTATTTTATTTTELPAVRLFSPNGGECLVPGSSYTISWGQNSAVHHVALYESSAGYGTRPAYGSWFFMSAPGQVQLSRTIPGYDSANMVMWVVAHDANHNELVADTNDALFTISKNCGKETTTAAIAGEVLDPGGKPVAGAGVHIFTKDFSKNFGAQTDLSGKFKLVVPAGTYLVELFPPFERKDLLKPAAVEVSLNNGETRTLQLAFIAGAKVITGSVIFSNGQPVTDAEVGAYSGETQQWTSTFVDGSGRFTLHASGGTWQVGIRPREQTTAKWSWDGRFQEISFTSDATPETKTVNFVIPVADAALKIRTLDDKGNILAGAGVVVDTVKGGDASVISGLRVSPEFRTSDVSGTAAFSLRAGTYYIRAYLPPERGYLNPEERAAAILSGQTAVLDLVFRKPDSVTAVMVTGTAKLDDGTPVDAFIWAWSEKGGFNQTPANAKGEFTLQLAANTRWRVGAGKEVSGFPYKSAEIIVEVQNAVVRVELILAKFREEPLPPKVEISRPATEKIIVQAQDGAKVVVPERGAAASGTVKAEIAPTVNAPSQAGARVVSTVYEVVIRDAQEQKISQLLEEIEVTIPYRKEDLVKQGVAEGNIVPAFFDETAGAWVRVDNYTIDKENQVVRIRVEHLTRFAIIAAADITPPDPPAAVSVAALAGGRIRISWVNPTKDFSHVKIYRSETAGSVGTIAIAEAKGVSVEDTGVTNGRVYYYLARTVDLAGNESTNTNQIAATAIGTSVKEKTLPPGQAVKLEILRNLTTSSRGDDVKALQEFLLKDGVYPEGLITGFFGSLTKRAVIRFQEKYAGEILKPLGLVAGTGFVGSATRAKIQQLLSR